MLISHSVSHAGLTYNGTVTPVQAWTGPEDSRMLRLPDSKTNGT
jgi:hypothetical protein